MNKHLVFYILIGACGILIGLILQRPLYPEPDSTQSVSFSSAQQHPPTLIPSVNKTVSTDDAISENQTMNIQTLTDAIAKEQQARALLEIKIAELEKQISFIQAAENTAQPEQVGTQNFHARSQTTVVPQDSWFNENALVVAGIDVGKINYLRNRFEELEMQQLYLRDQAVREGWISSERYQNAIKEISTRNDELRKELTEKEYDAYLYAAGRPNRVKIISALSNSPANNAGIKPGDIIYKYDTKRIYSWQDLRTATAQGNANETVTVVVERDGSQQTLYVPRGPLGVRLDSDSVAP